MIVKQRYIGVLSRDMREIYSAENTYVFSIADREFRCNREEWGDNNHILWKPDIDTEDCWNIDVINKSFRTKDNCVKYMKKQILKTLKQMIKDMEND